MMRNLSILQMILLITLLLNACGSRTLAPTSIPTASPVTTETAKTSQMPASTSPEPPSPSDTPEIPTVGPYPKDSKGFELSTASEDNAHIFATKIPDWLTKLKFKQEILKDASGWQITGLFDGDGNFTGIWYNANTATWVNSLGKEATSYEAPWLVKQDILKLPWTANSGSPAMFNPDGSLIIASLPGQPDATGLQLDPQTVNDQFEVSFKIGQANEHAVLTMNGEKAYVELVYNAGALVRVNFNSVDGIVSTWEGTLDTIPPGTEIIRFGENGSTIQFLDAYGQPLSDVIPTPGGSPFTNGQVAFGALTDTKEGHIDVLSLELRVPENELVPPTATPTATSRPRPSATPGPTRTPKPTATQLVTDCLLTNPRTDQRSSGKAGAVAAEIFKGHEFEGTVEMYGKVISINGDLLTFNFGDFQRDVDVSRIPINWLGEGRDNYVRKFGPGCGVNFQVGDGALIWVDVGLSGDQLRNIWNSAPNSKVLEETLTQILTNIPSWKVVHVSAPM